MPEEARFLWQARPEEKPPGFPRTILAAVGPNEDCATVLERIRETWATVAGLGRWCDEELGEWPPFEECMSRFPEWFQGVLRSEAFFEVENWLDDVHDREWVWWSSACLGRTLKIDLSAYSLPMSTWPVEYVIEKAGAHVIHNGDWLPATACANWSKR